MKPMIRFSWLAFAFAAVIHSATANEAFKFDASRSTIRFRVHQFLGTTNGKFIRFSGNIDLDRQRPEQVASILESRSATITCAALNFLMLRSFLRSHSRAAA